MNTDKKQWPLIIVHTVADIEATQIHSADALLESSIRQLYLTTRKMLEKEGRMRDWRQLTLVCHNEDEQVVKIVKTNHQIGEEK